MEQPTTTTEGHKARKESPMASTVEFFRCYITLCARTEVTDLPGGHCFTQADAERITRQRAEHFGTSRWIVRRVVEAAR